MPKAQSKGCQRKKRIQQEPGINEQSEQKIDSEDKEGDLQDSCSTLGVTNRNRRVMVSFKPGNSGGLPC